MAGKDLHTELKKELSMKSDSVVELESVIRDLSENLVQSEIHTRFGFVKFWLFLLINALHWGKIDAQVMLGQI